MRGRACGARAPSRSATRSCLSTSSGPTAARSEATADHGALARFEPLYDPYDVHLADLSPGEHDSVFRGTATAWLGLEVGGGVAAHNGTQ